MRRGWAFLAAAALSALPAGPACGAEVDVMVPWIEVTRADRGEDHVTIAAKVTATQEAAAEFAMTILKGSGGNKTASKQSGRFTADPAAPKTLSTTTVNIAPGDHLEVTLDIIVGGDVIAEAAITAKGE